MFVVILLILCVCSVRIDSSSFHRFPYQRSFAKGGTVVGSDTDYKWKEEWFDVPLDHFSFATDRTFPLRYLINTEYYDPGGPIFFYTGNEGDVEGFAANTGLMWDWSPEFSAALVFAEHRFYGKTKPFGNDSYSKVAKLGYLSSAQALADFATLIVYLKQERLKGAWNSSVIAFGGSYGGMLSAWIRIKYPHLVDGAIAASAPVFWFLDTAVPENIFDRIVTRSFVNSGCRMENIIDSWPALERLAMTDDGRSYLNHLFKLEEKSCLKKPDDVLFLKQSIREVFESIAMVNYPYACNFLSPLPGWPVQFACEFFKRSPESDEQRAQNFFLLIDLYYNYTGEKTSYCLNPDVCSDSAYSALGDPMGWPWQSCTEMVMQQCASGPPNDFFWKDCPFTIKDAIERCKKDFGKIGYGGALMRSHWIIANYGNRYPTATNIIFSNGYLDPWSGGGWSLTPKTVGSLVSIIIEDGAHHYDLRGSHPKDTEAVKEARRLEKAYVIEWLEEARTKKRAA